MANPPTQQALVLNSQDQPLSLSEVPLPVPTVGAAVVTVFVTNVSPAARKMYSGQMPSRLTTPIVPSSQAIGRIYKLGPDSTSLHIGQLVYVDITVRSRDNPNDTILQGYFGGFGNGTKLMEQWRSGTFAQYAQVPLENLYPLNEDVLLKQMGYTPSDLCWIGPAAVSAGAMNEIPVRAGDTVIIAPATGFFGGACVHLALAMGARVIAAGRNEKVLAKMADTFRSTERLLTVKLSGDIETDTAALKKASGKDIDAFVDWSPPEAAKSTHIQACLGALRPFGKAVLMGGIWGNVEIPYLLVMTNSLHIMGRFMYDREHVQQLIKLVEAGLMKLGPGEASGVNARRYKLADVETVLSVAESEVGFADQVLLEIQAVV